MNVTENSPLMNTLSTNTTQLKELKIRWEGRLIHKKDVKYNKEFSDDLISLEDKICTVHKGIINLSASPEDVCEKVVDDAKDELGDAVKKLKEIRDKFSIVEQDTTTNKIIKLIVRFYAWITFQAYVEVNPLPEEALDKLVKEVETLPPRIEKPIFMGAVPVVVPGKKDEPQDPSIKSAPVVVPGKKDEEPIVRDAPVVELEKKDEIQESIVNALRQYVKSPRYVWPGKWIFIKTGAEEDNKYQVIIGSQFSKRFQITKGRKVTIEDEEHDGSWGGKRTETVNTIQDLFKHIGIYEKDFMYIDEVVRKIVGNEIVENESVYGYTFPPKRPEFLGGCEMGQLDRIHVLKEELDKKKAFQKTSPLTDFNSFAKQYHTWAEALSKADAQNPLWTTTKNLPLIERFWLFELCTRKEIVGENGAKTMKILLPHITPWSKDVWDIMDTYIAHNSASYGNKKTLKEAIAFLQGKI